MRRGPSAAAGAGRARFFNTLVADGLFAGAFLVAVCLAGFAAAIFAGSVGGAGRFFGGIYWPARDKAVKL